MSLNIVKSDGSLETVAGLVNSEKINEMYEAFPSDSASASNKLVIKSDVPYINQTIANVANVESFGESLRAYGARSLAGKTSINGQWYDYVSTIQGNTASGGSWVGNAILWGNNGDFYTLSKEYSASSAWNIQKLVKESDLAIKKKDISATGGATSFSTTIPLSMAQRNQPFYLEVLSVGNSNAIKEMKYRVFVSSINTNVTTQEISKDSNFTNVSITFDESTGYALSFSSTETLYSTVIYIQQ